MTSRVGAAEDEHESSEPGLTIEQVSQIVELPVPTIRSWERRYQLPVVSRTAGGHRRYTSAQLDSVRRMRELVRQGLRPGDAAARVKAEDAASPPALIAALLQAAREFEPEAIEQVLNQTQHVLGLGRTVDQVLLPAMRQIGEEWQAGHADISHEHLASNTARAWLATITQTAPTVELWQPIVLCCGPRDDHTLGLEALHALLCSRGFPCRLLGARTPADSLALAVRETAADAVVLVCHLPSGRQAAVEALRQHELSRTTIFYAGGAFASTSARQGVPGHYLGDNLTHAAEVIGDAVLAATAARPAERR